MGADIARLENEKDCRRVNSNHEALVEFYRPQRDIMEECLNTLRGKLYTEKELEGYAKTNMVPISINKALAPFRTVMGTIAQSGFDADFKPQEESDEELAEILNNLAIYEAEKNDDFGHNGEICQAAYSMGRGYRWHWVEQGIGIKPQIRSKVLNPFAVYFDSESIEIISRSDALFVDVVHWLSVDEILKGFPDAEKKIVRNEMADRNLRDYYEHYDKSANRKHENQHILNGKHKVIERYYKVPVDDPFGKRKDELYLAVWAPELLYDNSFLFNGPYNVQPIDPDTGKVMFPIIELVSDNMFGESDGFIKPMKDPIKIISVLYTQLIEGAKHSGTGYLVNRNGFDNDEEYERFMLYGSRANQRYSVNVQNGGINAVQPIQGTPPPQINLQALSTTEHFVEDMSSATPALQGRSEGGNTPASLNAQRIEQATIQLTTFFNFLKRHLRQTLKLRYAYWRETYTEEFTFRVFTPNAEGDGSRQSFTMNQEVAVNDWNGIPTEQTQKINDINAAEFDVVIADSFRSPTSRVKMKAGIEALIQSPIIAANPEMAAALAEEYLELSDVPRKLKERFRQAAAAQQQQQQQQQEQMAQQMQMEQQMQGQEMGTEQLKQMALLAKTQGGLAA